uniref:Uncharacterized protein n=1 Tax=Candidatus Kentrum sp. TC TaxID=2126339 RepID=A0A451ADY9_9GAMM|nr:MAG: hypothetical protein BECKTC1821F_GA0114240_11186 [Candidatus Kentron sp. TC]
MRIVFEVTQDELPDLGFGTDNDDYGLKNEHETHRERPAPTGCLCREVSSYWLHIPKRDFAVLRLFRSG